MAEAMGVDTFRVKVTAFVLAALLASVSGWLFAHFQRTVNPSPFGLNMGIEYLFMAVLGGVGHVWGALVGAGVVQILKDQLQVWLPKLMGTSGNYEIIVFGILLVLVLQYARDGIWAFVEAALPRVRAQGRLGRRRRRCPRAARPPHGEVVLDVRAVRKEFGGLVAVNDVSFQVRAGEILGLIGPERRRQVDHLQPRHRRAAGDARRGHAARRAHRLPGLARDRPARRLAHLPARQDDRRHDGARERRPRRAPARPPRRAVGDAAPRSRRGERQPVQEAEKQLRRIGMGELMHELAGNLALGQQRLMEIARALCADPTLLLLDEPAAGLRLKEKQALADVLRQLRGEGMSILLVEHDMDLVMGLVDRVVVMEFGTKLIEGTPRRSAGQPGGARGLPRHGALKDDPTFTCGRRPMLKVDQDLHAGYGRAEVLHGLNLEGRAGSVITVIGPNGAGKSTLLNALMGVLPARGTVEYDGQPIGLLSLEERVMLGMALVPGTRALFATCRSRTTCCSAPIARCGSATRTARRRWTRSTRSSRA